MFVQTQEKPNPNSLKFIPGKLVSNSGSFEINSKDEVNNDLIRNILSINGVTGIFLGKDFLSVNKNENTNWEDLRHIVISFINEYYADGKEFVIDKKLFVRKNMFKGKIGLFEIKKNKISHILNFYKVEDNNFKKIF